MPTWSELQKERRQRRQIRQRARSMEREAERAGAPPASPARELGATLFQAGDRGALPIGLGALPQGAWRMLLNVPYGITAITSNLRSGEYSPLKIGADVVSNVLATREGVIAQGNFFGRDVVITGPRPERLSFNEELRLWGVPELGRLSQIPVVGAAFTPSGKGLPFREKGPLDISGRSVAGLLGEAVVTSGVAPSIRTLGRVVGVAKGPAGTVLSRVTASKLGQRTFDRLYQSELVRRFGPKAAEMETKISLEVMEDIRDEAATKLFDMAHADPRLVAQPELFLGPLRIGGRGFVSAAERMRSAITRRLARYEPWTKATDFVAQGARSFERLFSVVPAAARRYPWVEESLSRFFGGRRQGFQAVTRQWQRWSAGLTDDEMDMLRDALDGREGPLPEGLDRLAADIRNWHVDMARVEMQQGYRYPERVNYLHHVWRVNGKPITKKQWQQLRGAEVGFQTDTIGRSIGGATKPRTYDSYAEGVADLQRIADAKGLGWKIEPGTLKESILRRGFAHVEAVEYAKVEAALARAHGMEATAAAEQHFRTILPEIDALLAKGEAQATGMYRENATNLRELLQRRGLALQAKRNPRLRELLYGKEVPLTGKGVKRPPLTPKAIEKADQILARAKQRAGDYAMRRPTKAIMKRVSRETEIVKALYWLQRMRQTTNAEDFFQLLDDRKRLGELDDEIFRPLADYIGNSYQNWTNTFRDRYGKALVTFKGRTHTYYLPEPLVDVVTRLERVGAIDADLMDALNVYDTTTTLYKGLVTSHVLSFHTRNAYNNLATMYVELGLRALDPRAWMRSLAVMRGAEGTIRSGERRFGYSQMRDGFRRYGILNDQDFALESAQLAPRNKVLELAPFRRGRQFGTFIENWAKATHMTMRVELGDSMESAAWRTQQILFDYDWLTPFERKWLRRAFPFYTWYRKNRVLQAQFMVTRPGRLVNVERLRGQNFREQAPDQEALPDYLRGAFKLRFERQGNVTYVYGIDLPHRAFLDNIYTRDGGIAWMRTIGAEASSLAPWLQGLMAAATGTDPMTRRDLSEPYTVPPGTAAIMKAMPEPLREWMEFVETKGYGGETRYQCNAAKAFLFFRSLAIERVIWPVGVINSAIRRDSDLDNILLDIATGIKIEEMDLTTVQQRMYRERLKNAEQRLIKAGKRRSFTTSYPVEQ